MNPFNKNLTEDNFMSLGSCCFSCCDCNMRITNVHTYYFSGKNTLCYNREGFDFCAYCCVSNCAGEEQLKELKAYFISNATGVENYSWMRPKKKIMQLVMTRTGNGAFLSSAQAAERKKNLDAGMKNLSEQEKARREREEEDRKQKIATGEYQVGLLEKQNELLRQQNDLISRVV